MKKKKIFNDHQLFQEMIFMHYAAGKKKDIPMRVTAKDIYTGRSISIDATSVNEVIDFQSEIDNAADKLVNYVDILSDILGGKEITYGE